MIRPVLRSAAIAVAALLAGPGLADVTLSSSNNPTIQMNTRISNLFQAEGRTVTKAERRGLSRLVKAPKSDKAVDGVYTREELDKLPAAKGGKEWSCLSEALYFEARGETVKGIFAVAEVIMNRVDDPRYPGTICGVVNQGTGERYRCQFTYTCDGRPEKIGNAAAYERVGKVASLVMKEDERPLTKGATHYHTKSVKPKWSRVFPRTTTIGYHHFYREPDRFASR